jgi:hypothetical protein
VLSLLLSLVACGGSGNTLGGGDEPTVSSDPSTDPSTRSAELTPDEKTAVAGLEQAMLTSEDKLDSSNATCLATGYVDRLGITWLQAHGMLGDDLSGKQTYFDDVVPEQDANAFYDVMLSCVDYKSIVASMVAEPPDMKDPYVIKCVNAVSEDEVREAFAAAASDQDFHSTPFAKKLERAGCGYEGD